MYSKHVFRSFVPGIIKPWKNPSVAVAVTDVVSRIGAISSVCYSSVEKGEGKRRVSLVLFYSN